MALTAALSFLTSKLLLLCVSFCCPGMFKFTPPALQSAWTPPPSY